MVNVLLSSPARTPWSTELTQCVQALGDRVVRLREMSSEQLGAVMRMGPLRITGCNDVAKLTLTAPADGVHVSPASDVVRWQQSPFALDLFSRHFALVFAVVAPVESWSAHTLLFFSRFGVLLYQVQVGAVAEFEQLVSQCAHPDQLPPRLDAAPWSEVSSMRVDVTTLEQDWSRLREPGDFDALLRRHGIRRLRAYRKVRDKFARAVSLDSVPALLMLAAARHTPLTISCSNAAGVLRHQGRVPLAAGAGPQLWLGQGAMSLALDLRQVASVWRVRKPTCAGIVTTVELFNGADERVLTLSSGRHFGRWELPSWRALLADCLLPPEQHERCWPQAAEGA